ncbi:universal stress protein [Pontibacter litorisediminis]|uniref:universal stress protein n=1 Tax=Pontibacter litorisediminis TaxID=1846260 RepID=UPI0023EDE57D|nr:universal stress protein [Pontibacter litorisediminis]
MLRLLVATDFSDNAAAAMRTALLLGRSYTAEVIFLHAMDRPLVPATSPPEIYNSIYQAEQQELEQRLQQQVQELSQELDLRPREVLKSVQILPTPVALSVLQLISRRNIRLVIMGSSGVSGFKRLLMGSNTTEMIRLTPVPLLIVPGGYNFRGFQKITVVIRMKRFGNRPGLSILDRLSHTYSASVYFLFILDEEDSEPEAVAFAQTEELAKGLPHEVITIRRRDKNEELERHLQKTRTDLLVWLPMPGGFWRDSMSESFTEEIAAEAGLPLLVIPHLKEDD